ncbi:MAG: DUF814 domain-containing protein [SAR324 cluster bacterium]|nr:DUF814 domain-containing protein [SAR324 cluster bacterium]
MIQALFPDLLQSRIQKISQPFPHCIVLEIYIKREAQRWLFSAHPQFARICQTWQHFPNPPMPPIFCLWLRTRILYGSISHLRSLDEHVLEIEIQRHHEHYFIIWEENGPHSNLLLLNENHHLLTALHNPNHPGRVLKKDKPYVTPDVVSRIIKETDHTLQNAFQLDKQFWDLELADNQTSQQKQYVKHFRRLKKKLARRLEKQERDLENCQKAGQYRQWGELLKPNLHQLQSGQTSIVVTNYFDEALPAITIPLNPRYNASENLEHLFAKANKLQKAVPHVEKRILQTLEEQELLNKYSNELSTLDSPQEWTTWEKQLPRFLKHNIYLLSHKSAKGPHDSGTVDTPLTRISSDGILLVTGRNKQQNAHVTFSIGRGNDWWFHAQGVPGAHVIVKYPKTPLPSKTLLEAAQLAAYYCKVRANRKIEVDYTQRKYVRKIKGGEPGQVIYTQNKSILVELDDELLQKLLDRESSDSF